MTKKSYWKILFCEWRDKIVEIQLYTFCFVRHTVSMTVTLNRPTDFAALVCFGLNIVHIVISYIWYMYNVCSMLYMYMAKERRLKKKCHRNTCSRLSRLLSCVYLFHWSNVVHAAPASMQHFSESELHGVCVWHCGFVRVAHCTSLRIC